MEIAMPNKYPPALDLGEAIRVVKDIHGIHSTQRFNVDSLDAGILKTSKTSSYFNRRIAALQTFGLLNRSGDLVNLTPLADQIANPVAGEDAEAKLAAFHKVDVLSDLLERYPNTKLPPLPDTLKQVLLKSIGIEKDRINDWYEFVVESFRAISGIAATEQPPIREDMRITPGTGRINVGEANQEEMIRLPSGRTFSFTLEPGFTEDDVEFIMAFFELKSKGFDSDEKK
jgi:hypothetical protein